MRRYLWLGGPAMLLGFSGCLPPNYFPSLLGSGISGVFSVLLTDALNVLVPPI
jgi:hypothetical protein